MTSRGTGIHLRMSARDTTEPGRSSSPLEALYDLVFVVAVGSLVAQLVLSIEHGEVLAFVIPYLMVFFAIWWAWINFTWFASAYDTDDVVYRVLTVLQMAGVLVIAAGVPSAFEGDDFLLVTLGYVIIRVGQIAQWVRAALENPQTRVTSLRYAGGVLVVQLLWVLRQLVPLGAASVVPAFALLATLEMLTPLWAERRGHLAWHPHHIAERYSLFVVILLGESVLAAVTGLRTALAAHGVTVQLVVVAVAGLVLLVALWWAYFLQSAGEGLAERRERSFVWGYGHYLLFAALAAVGGGLDAAVQASAHPGEVQELVIGLALAVPAAACTLLIWGLHAFLLDDLGYPWVAAVPAAVLILVAGAVAPRIGVVGATVAIALIAAGSIAIAVALAQRGPKPAG
jgi:low temperature requirement protein LtrA